MKEPSPVVGKFQGVDVVTRIHHPTVKWVAKQVTNNDELEWILSHGKTGYIVLRTPQPVSVRIHFAFEHDTENPDRIAITAWMPEEDRKIASAHMARIS